MRSKRRIILNLMARRCWSSPAIRRRRWRWTASRLAAHVPVVGVIEPGAEAAAAASKNQRIVVIGTEATVSSHAYRKALEARGLRAREKACPLLVPLVEEGWVEHPVTEQVARIYLAEAFADGFSDADTLVLGCTHYPLLKPLLRRVAPGHVSIVDSAESTARAVAARNQHTGVRALRREERRAAAAAQVLCHGFGGEVSPAGRAISGAADRGRGARRFEGIGAGARFWVSSRRLQEGSTADLL